MIPEFPIPKAVKTYLGALKYDTTLQERAIINQLGGTFTKDSTGLYLLQTTTKWPGEQKIYIPLMIYPYGTAIHNANGTYVGLWTIIPYEDTNGTTIQLEIRDTTGNLVELDTLISTNYLYLPQIYILK